MILRGQLAYDAEETCRLLSMMMLDAIGNFGNGSGLSSAIDERNGSSFVVLSRLVIWVRVQNRMLRSDGRLFEFAGSSWLCNPKPDLA